MVRHIVIWDFADGFTESENRENATKIKSELEGLKGLIPGVLEIKVVIDYLPSSNGNIMLDSLFESEEAFKNYIEHPEHKRVGLLVRPSTQNRKCMDFFV